MSEGNGKGFSSLSPERVREIAVQGGKAAHKTRKGKHRAHEWTAEEAREAGRKGGLAAAAARRRNKATR
jgi:uncharacterized protein